MNRPVVAAFVACALMVADTAAWADGAAKAPLPGGSDAAHFEADFHVMYASYSRCYEAAKEQDASTFNASVAIQACKEAQQLAIALRHRNQKPAPSPARIQGIADCEGVASIALERLLGSPSAPPAGAVAVSVTPPVTPLAGGGGSLVAVGPSSPDRDGDGIPDAIDACPDVPGPWHSDPRKNGCPVVHVTDSEVIILEEVQFDSNQASIPEDGDKLLDQVAVLLKDHPEIAKIELQGHADSSGPRVHNKQISQAHAESVMRALKGRGVDKARLIAKGFGQDVPIADNDTAAGRQKNRRVQFKIVEQKRKPPMKKAPRAGVLGHDLAPNADLLKE